MKRSSAYPALFGRAFRIAHELGIKYGDTRVHGKEILDEIDMRVRGLLAQLPPEGEELPRETRTIEGEKQKD